MAYCTLCNRPLTDKASVQRGIGPDCWADLQARHQQAQSATGDKSHVWTGDFEGDIILTRLDGAGPGRKGLAGVNIPQRVVRHSPTGMEWGYGGSGPADLAYNILLCYTDQATTEKLYQEFKWAFVASLPEAGGTIAGEKIRAWVGAQQSDLFSQPA